MEASGQTGLRSSVFWRVSLVLVVVQLATGLLAVGFTIWFASDRSGDLAENSFRMRLDAVAEEIERGAVGQDLELGKLPETLRLNLSLRLPDPLSIVALNGKVVSTVYPSPDVFSTSADSSFVPVIPEKIGDLIETGDVTIDRTDDTARGGWALAPLYDAAGFPIGGLVVQPVERSMAMELAPTFSAFRSAMWVVALTGFLLALGLGGGFTWWLVRPLRQMTKKVDEIGAGDFEARMNVDGNNEIARLGRTINLMAERVERSMEDLRNTDRIRRELVANVGHDLRTPLAALRGHAEEGLRFLKENRRQEAEAALNAAQAQVDHIDNLVTDLFELSQLETPNPPLHLEPVPIAELLSDAIRGNAPQAKQADLRMDAEIAKGLPVIRGDGARLLRIMNNLLSNAIRHTPPGGRVALDAKLEGDEVQIRISDTGEGIEDADLEHVFERYYRGQSSRTRKGGGTGLGLAISRAVARGHGGALTAESTHGHGTVMTLVLPVTPAEGPA
jgi:signal transduction histidine kinase